MIGLSDGLTHYDKVKHYGRLQILEKCMGKGQELHKHLLTIFIARVASLAHKEISGRYSP